jgi:Ion transport protein
MLIYSILGVYLFSEIKFNGALTVDSNFTSVGSAFLLLIRITTGERWPEMMKAVSQQYSPMYLCIKDPTYADYALNGCK